jgi:hypothetical protein
MEDVTGTRDPRVRKACLDCEWYRVQLSRGDRDEITADISALFERHLREGRHTPRTVRSVPTCGS